MENLLYYDQVRLLPIFQYSNIYTVTSNIGKLYDNHELQEECQRAVGKNSTSLPQLSHIMMLYCRYGRVSKCNGGRFCIVRLYGALKRIIYFLSIHKS